MEQHAKGKDIFSIHGSLTRVHILYLRIGRETLTATDLYEILWKPRVYHGKRAELGKFFFISINTWWKMTNSNQHESCTESSTPHTFCTKPQECLCTFPSLTDRLPLGTKGNAPASKLCIENNLLAMKWKIQGCNEKVILSHFHVLLSLLIQLKCKLLDFRRGEQGRAGLANASRLSPVLLRKPTDWCDLYQVPALPGGETCLLPTQAALLGRSNCVQQVGMEVKSRVGDNRLARVK